MNKLTSGAIVGTLGIALLLGGAGTFATWNQSTTANAGTVASGTLTIANSGTASWKNISADAPTGGAAIANIASYKIVPGDTLEMTQTFTVAASGDNLKATLNYSPDSIVATTDADKALKTAATYAFTATGAAGSGITTDATTKVVTVSSTSAGVNTVTVKLVVALPKDVSGITAQGGSLNLSAVSFNLTQNTRA